jgi:hypothetical protein
MGDLWRVYDRTDAGGIDPTPLSSAPRIGNVLLLVKGILRRAEKALKRFMRD